MLAVFKEREMYARIINLFSNCSLIENLFEFTANRPEKLIIGRHITLPEPIEFPPELKGITVEYDGEHLFEIIDFVTGIEQQVILRATDDEMASEAIIACIEQLKIKKSKSNRSITNMPHDYKFIEESGQHFNLSQIAETVFIFHSMARGRGGRWRYFVRLEKAESGAIGMAHYLDSTQVEEDRLYQTVGIRCEYFPTMESFLDYFEREVGSKRRTRDWMQLRKKDETVESREENFGIYNDITSPYIQLNKQQEAIAIEESQKMEEEMRKIEEEFAFQEKWIRIFMRGKIFKRDKFFENIPEHLILKIITKMQAKAFFNLLRTGKWMLLLCEENRRNLLIPFDISNYHINYIRERSKVIQQLRKTIRSKYYFFLYDARYVSIMPILEDFYSKEAYHFRRVCWNIDFLRINKFPINISIINHLQPIHTYMELNGPLPENLSIPARTKHFFVYYVSISDSDFYKEIERFGSLSLKLTFIRIRSHLELTKLLSIWKGITQERHQHHSLQFLTYRRESRSSFEIFDSWPMDSFFPSSRLFYFIIVAKSDVGVSVIHLYRFDFNNGIEAYTLQIMEIKSFDEWEKFTKREIMDRRFNLEAGQTREESDKQLAVVLEDFSTQIASKFFEEGKLVYPPLAPEPASEFVEFLKKFEDFDIQPGISLFFVKELPEKLAPHKPKWKKTEKLPKLPRKLPEIHSNNWLIEAREVIKLRKIWLNFLQKRKFILELIPLKNVLDIARRIERKRFPLLFSSTKWVNELIQNSSSNFRIHGGSSRFSMKRIYRNSSGFKKVLKSLEFYYLNKIRFVNFNDDTNYLKEVLGWVRERKIFVKQIALGYNCPLIQEFFESFARGPESLHIHQYTTLLEPIKLSPQLKEIVVDVNLLKENRIERTKEMIEGFTGIEQAVIWTCYLAEDTNTTITHHLETLKSKMCRSNILIRSQNIAYSRIFGRQFDLSQISEEVFIFRSMARGRGGAWNYFIRLEKAGSGAVGMAHFMDSIQLEKDRLNRFNIRCEYFPTTESFLDYFEREVRSKRRARDWMQLREKDETIDPREKDFKKLKMLTPFIHFNEQKEADDFKEARRRFFS